MPIIQPCVLLQNSDAIGRYIKAIVLRVFYENEVIDFIFNFHFQKAAVAANAMILMDKEIPFFQLTETGPFQGIFRCFVLGPRPGSFRPENFIFTDDIKAQIGPGKTL